MDLRSLVAAMLVLVACHHDAPKPAEVAPAPTASAAVTAATTAPVPSSPQLALPCKVKRAAPNTDTHYACPSDAALAQCAASDVTACIPKGRARGAVPPGGKCVHPTSADAAKWELGDDCAPNPRTTSNSSPKGSICVMESGPGAYCTHDCNTSKDCADLKRDGFVAECFSSMCSMSKR